MYNITCNQCDKEYESSNSESIKCRTCQQVTNVNNRKIRRSKCIIESMNQLAKYKEIKDSQLLIDKFNNQFRCCYWCKTELECPKLDKSYENNYNQPSLDRIDNDDDHNINNVNITCWMCNIMRGETTFELFTKIINILLGKSHTLDLTCHDYINKLTDKRFTIDYKRVRKEITPDNLKKLYCRISNFPIFLGSISHHPLLPSWDRKYNCDENGAKMEHCDDNIEMICAFINMGRNSINYIDDFIKIFNNKFPNRSLIINVIYPTDYKYIEKYECFVNEKYAKDKLWQPHIPLSGIKKFKSVIKKVIFHINQCDLINKWCNEYKRLPEHKNDLSEKVIYALLSKLKNIKIYNNLLTSEYIKDIRTLDEKNSDDWDDKLDVLVKYIRDNHILPIHTCENKNLWNWICTQKKKFKQNKLYDEQIKKLDNIKEWWWTEIHQGYKTHIIWFNNHIRMIPKKEEHKSVYNWYNKIRKYYLIEDNKDKKYLHHYDRDLIKTIPIFNEWIKYDCPISKNHLNYNDFTKKYKYVNE
jgi:hypothetical protein